MIIHDLTFWWNNSALKVTVYILSNEINYIYWLLAVLIDKNNRRQTIVIMPVMLLTW